MWVQPGSSTPHHLTRALTTRELYNGRARPPPKAVLEGLPCGAEAQSPEGIFEADLQHAQGKAQLAPPPTCKIEGYLRQRGAGPLLGKVLRRPLEHGTNGHLHIGGSEPIPNGLS